MQFTEGDVARVQAARAKRSRFSLGPLFTPARSASVSGVKPTLADQRPLAVVESPRVIPEAHHKSGVEDRPGEAPEAEDVIALRAELREMQRRYSTAEALLHKADQELRERPSTSSTSIAYLRHVVVSYLALGDGDESAALFQVIATFLQFDEEQILKLQRVRQQKAAAQGSLLGHAAVFLRGR